MQIMAALRNACPLNPEHRNVETQFVSLAPKLNSKWLNGFLHVLRKYIYDLFNVFKRKCLNLLYTDFKLSTSFLLVLVTVLSNNKSLYHVMR